MLYTCSYMPITEFHQLPFYIMSFKILEKLKDGVRLKRPET